MQINGLPDIGKQLGNGAYLFEQVQVDQRWAFVLGFFPDHGAPFVTWLAKKRPDHTWSTADGHYHEDLRAAIDDLEKRARMWRS